ncbi:MAG: hypothetical protein CVT49_11400 [candidate division Zixibacteria bacterium HGW-Zixibacteria-1]|nr:MAG: hypothetical protein CVT49_11400 [candidate division Zixibacteria bacterium HGW-Zixibacteria-1]
MDTKKRQRIIYVIFIAAVIWGVYNLSGNKPRTQVDVPRPVAKLDAIRTGIKTESINIEKYSALEWGRDPFYRGPKHIILSAVGVTQPVWTLSGILFDNNSPSAIINKKIVRGGDIINGARVVQVDKETVTLDKDGLQFTLTIIKEKS